MLRTLLLAFAAVVLFQKTTAQNLIPFLGKNGKYGYANERGEVQIQPSYEYLNLWDTKAYGSSTGIFIQQNKQPGFLLRNGMVIAGQRMPPKPVVNYADGNQGKGDTLSNLSIFRNDKKWVFVNQKTRQTREFPFMQDNYQKPKWFSWVGSNYYSSGYSFGYGYCSVLKENGRINFIDLDFKEVLATDYLAGAVGGPGLFVVGNESQKMGIVDKAGKARTPFVWSKIEQTNRPGYFLVSMASKLQNQQRTGMIDADGKIVIDTVYGKIVPAGKDHLIVERDNRMVLVDYTGKWVLPMDFYSIEPSFGDFFIIKSVGEPENVVNSKGEKQFKNSYTHIENYSCQGKKQGLVVSDGSLLGFVDTNFRVVFMDTLTSINCPQQADFSKKLTHFQVREGREKYDLKSNSIRDQTGKRLFPGVFDMISGLPGFGDDFYFVKKDSLYGVFDTDGKVVFPLNFLDIATEENPNKGEERIIWARAVGSKMYSAYDKTGKKRPIPDNFMPNSKRNQLLYIESPTQQPPVLVFSDGSRRFINPKDAIKYAKLWQAPSPDGGFIFEESDGQILVADAFLKNIIPEGYIVPKKMFDGSMELTGLLTVYQLPARLQREASKSQPPKDQQTGVELLAGPGQVKESPIEGADPIMSQDMPTTFETSGVINARGEWVVPPKKGAKYHPLSYYLVQEMSWADRDNSDMRIEPYPILRVNGATGQPLLINSVSGRVFRKENNFTMRLGKTSPDSQNGLYAAYFDHRGKQLTDFNFHLSREIFLKNRTLVTLSDKDGLQTNQILDVKGNVIVDFGNITVHPPRGSSGSVEYFVTQEGDSELNGLVDSTGRVLLPFQFQNLEIVAPGKLLSCRNNSSGTDLMDWRGTVIFSSPKIEFFKCQAALDGHLLATTGSITVVISPDGKLVRTLPYECRTVSKAVEFQRFAEFLDKKTNQLFWIDFVSGVEFRE
ncbi:MAG: hypothetical protein IT258_24295 [Saprospiraceae bacterium]|nr:hypothetical protein [Saprospiraceae bacterium]